MLSKCKSTSIGLLVAAAVGLGSASCKKADSRLIWSDILSKCSSSDLLPPSGELKYFGMSNTSGAGSILRSMNGGGYGLRWTSSDIGDAGTWTQVNNEASCAGSEIKKTNVNVGLSLTGVPTIDGDLAADIATARDVTVTVGSWRLEAIKESAWWDRVKGSSAPANLLQDAISQGRFVIDQAIRVDGVTAKITFTSDVAPSLKAKYEGKIGGLGSGGLSANFKASFSDNRTLNLTATQPFYIAGTLRPITAQGPAANEVLGPRLKTIGEGPVVNQSVMKR